MSSTTSAPAAAATAPQTVPVAGDLVADDEWHNYTAAVHVTNADGDITFTPSGFSGGRLSIRLSNAKEGHVGEVFSNPETTWFQGDLSTKTLATNVKATTHYTVEAKVGPPEYKSFAGHLHTR